MEENKKVLIFGIVIIVLLVLALGVYYFYIWGKSEKAVPVIETEKEQIPPQSEEAVEKEKKQMPSSVPVALDESDEWIRNLVKELSSYPKFLSLLMTDDIVRKFTAAVDNIANGASPQHQVDFFSPEGSFKVVKKGERYYINPETYERYDVVADIFSSLDSDKCAEIYRLIKPLIQEAYEDLGYPDEDFQVTFRKAIIELLDVPVIERDILLEKKVITYEIADDKLERLSPAQKHLFRMGPENIMIIQKKLREIASALGIIV